jgi:hypothetical protein
VLPRVATTISPISEISSIRRRTARHSSRRCARHSSHRGWHCYGRPSRCREGNAIAVDLAGSGAI